MITLEQAQAFIEAVGSDFIIPPSSNRNVNLKLDCEPERDMSEAFDKLYRARLKQYDVEVDSHYGRILHQDVTRVVQDRKRSAYILFERNDDATFNVEIRYECSDEEFDFIVNTVHVPSCGVDEHLASLAKNAKILYMR